MTTRQETVEKMLDGSQRVRDELAAAVGRLDSYIELLRADLGRDSTVPGNEPTSTE